MALRIAARDVGAAGARELGVELDGVADIDEEESGGRSSLAGSARAYCSAWPRALRMASSNAALPRIAVPFFADFAFAFPASESAASSSRFSTPCLVSRT